MDCAAAPCSPLVVVVVVTPTPSGFGPQQLQQVQLRVPMNAVGRRGHGWQWLGLRCWRLIAVSLKSCILMVTVGWEDGVVVQLGKGETAVALGEDGDKGGKVRALKVDGAHG